MALIYGKKLRILRKNWRNLSQIDRMIHANIDINFCHYDNTYNDFTYNDFTYKDFTYNFDKCDIIYMLFLFTVINKILYW